MGDSRNTKNYVRPQCMRLSNEDRLSSLPDGLITNILSRLQINSAIATSTLSHQWRYLWTTIANFTFDNDGNYVSKQTSEKFSTVVVDIVRQLTTQTLHTFKLQLSSLSHFRNPGVADSCFHEICSRNVEEIIIKAKPGNNNCFTIPGSLFSCKHLVVLILKAMIQFELPENADIQLPNLRKISLDYLVNGCQCLGSLFRSCQSLVEADLIASDYITQPEHQIVLNISAPNLKSLRLMFLPTKSTQRPKIFIDAPQLETLDVTSYISNYYTIKNPTKLAKASIHMYWNEGYSHVTAKEGVIQDVFKFVGGMSSVTDLTLRLEDNELTNMYRYLNSADLGVRITFPNLIRLETNLDYVGWKDLLISMKCFPNLRHLKVCLNMDSDLVMDPVNWCVPERLSKLKTIEISGVKAIDDELVLIGYILSNALDLEKLQVECIEFGYIQSEKEAQLWNVCKFCKPLFQLARASSTCEIVFNLCGLFRASSNNWKNGKLICEISSLLFDI